MKTRTTYICDFCGASYRCKEDAEKCEKQHAKPVGFGQVDYERATCVSDKRVSFPKYVYIRFDNGGVVRYRIE